MIDAHYSEFLEATANGDLSDFFKNSTLPKNVNHISNGSAAIHLAARFNKVANIIELIERAAQIELRDEKGLTALHIAVLNGNLNAVLLLVAEGADPNATVSEYHLKTPTIEECHTAVCTSEFVGKTAIQLAEIKGFDKISSALKGAQDDKIWQECVEIGEKIAKNQFTR